LSRLAVYESQIVRVIFAGISLEDGRSDPFFQIQAHGDAYVVEGPGADGHVAFCGTNDNLYEITLSFKGTSNVHQALSAIHIADRKAFNGAGIAPLICEDSSGATLIQTDRCRIMALPQAQFGITRKDVDWKLMAVIEPGGFLLGGN
jgi:hypothetical protein